MRAMSASSTSSERNASSGCPVSFYRMDQGEGLVGTALTDPQPSHPGLGHAAARLRRGADGALEAALSAIRITADQGDPASEGLATDAHVVGGGSFDPSVGQGDGIAELPLEMRRPGSHLQCLGPTSFGPGRLDVTRRLLVAAQHRVDARPLDEGVGRRVDDDRLIRAGLAKHLRDHTQQQDQSKNAGRG